MKILIFGLSCAKLGLEEFRRCLDLLVSQSSVYARLAVS